MTENAIVEQAAREYLETLPDGEVMSTRQLTEALALADLAPFRVATVLCRLAPYQLSDCAEYGEPILAKRGFNRGKMVRPWHWTKPRRAALTPEQVLDARLKEIFAVMRPMLDRGSIEDRNDPKQQDIMDSIKSNTSPKEG